MITSVDNRRIRNLVQLNQKVKIRREQKVFIAEGMKMFLEAPLSWIREVYISESFAMRREAEEKLKAVCYETVSDEVFCKAADTVTPQGILTVVRQPEYDKEQLLEKADPLWVILEDMQDPGNLGTILRTGEGAGITGVILTKGCVDLYNPKTIRATMGSIYRVPALVTEELPREIGRLQERGVTVYAAHLEGKADYDELSYRSGSAFLIGNEGNGLRRETAGLADLFLKIPMQGSVESLNAGAAASILMYEAARQRKIKGGFNNED